jgi:serine/threonine protein kinase
MSESAVRLLVTRDQQLAAGLTSAANGTQTPESPEHHAVLERGLACVELLRKHWPSTGATGASEFEFTHLGHFQIESELGRGTFGIVFRAHDPRLGRDVALKVPRPEALVTAELRRRFVREAQAAAGLEHPNIVTIYEAGEVGSVLYIASAYVPGTSLSAWLQGRTDAVAARSAAEIVATLADAVQHAHVRGVVHRDLKPANILLQGPENGNADLSSLTPKIADFGLARLLPDSCDESAGEETAETRSGVIVGTPVYMAPEQARGMSRSVGPPADIYALGAILYELLVGRPPLRGETTLETLELVRSQEPVSPRRFLPKLSRDLETICLKCLEKSPAARYANAGALADDLRRFLAGEPTRARRASLWRRSAAWAKRRPARTTALIVGGGALAALAAVIVGYTLRLGKANADLHEALDVAHQQRQVAESSSRLARRAIDDFSTRVAWDSRLRAQDLEKLRKELLQSALAFYKEFVAQQPGNPNLRAEQAAAHARLAYLAQDLGSTDEAIDSFRKALDIYDRLTTDGPGDQERAMLRATMYKDLGVIYTVSGRLAEAEDSSKHAVVILEELTQAHPEAQELRATLAKSYHNLANLFQTTTRLKDAEEYYEKARSIHEELAPQHPDIADCQMDLASTRLSLGEVYRATGRHALSEKLLFQALEVVEGLERKYGQVPDILSLVATNRSILGLLYADTGKPADAVASWTSAKVVLEKLVQSHPALVPYQAELAKCLRNLAGLELKLDRLDDADAHLQQAGKLLDQLRQKAPADRALAYEVACVHDLQTSLERQSAAKATSPVGAVVETTLATKGEQIRQFAFDGDTASFFASAANAAHNDHFTLTFDRPVKVRSMAVLTGRLDGTDKLDRGTLAVSADGKAFEPIGRFTDGSVRVECNGRRIRSIRIAPSDDLKHALAIREFTIDSDPAIATFRYPVEFVVDVADAPEMKTWAEKVARICEKAYPMLNDDLKSEGFKPATVVTLTVSNNYQGVAATSGQHIVGSARYFKRNPNDVGAMVYETVHVIQRYRGPDVPGWLTEGVADYERFFRFEPGKLGRIDPASAHYDGSYRVTAAFLAYLTKKYDADIVRKLNKTLREGKYQPDYFKGLTGKPISQLDDEWRATLGRP